MERNYTEFKRMIEYIESLIAQGETEYAIKELLQYVSTNEYNLKKDIILTSSQLSRIVKNRKKVGGNSNEIEIQLYNIDYQILGYLDKIKHEYSQDITDNVHSNFLSINIEIPNLLKIPIQQYLIFFSECMYRAKGVYLEFEVVKNKLGLEISINNKDDIPLATIQEWLNEYVNFTKMKIEDLEVKVEVEDFTEIEYNKLIIELKNQINHLKKSLELIGVDSKKLQNENGLLSETVESDNIIKIESDNSNISPYNKAKDLISLGKSIKALELLISIVEEKDIHNELRIFFSRINTLNLDYRLGIIDETFRYKELNKINKSILDFIEILLIENKD